MKTTMNSNYYNMATAVKREPSIELTIEGLETQPKLYSVERDSRNFGGASPIGNAIPQSLQIVCIGKVDVEIGTSVSVAFGFEGNNIDEPTFYVIEDPVYDLKANQTTINCRDGLYKLTEQAYNKKLFKKDSVENNTSTAENISDTETPPTEGGEASETVKFTAKDWYKKFCNAYNFTNAYEGEGSDGSGYPEWENVEITENPNVDDEVFASTMLCAFAEAMCSNAYIHSGRILKIEPYRNAGISPAITLDKGIGDFSSSQPLVIDTVILSRAPVIDNVMWPESTIENPHTPVNTLTITNNPFIDYSVEPELNIETTAEGDASEPEEPVLDSRSLHIKRIAKQMIGQKLYPFSWKFRGMSALEIGDIIEMPSADRVVFFGDKFTYSQGVSSETEVKYDLKAAEKPSGTLSNAIKEAKIYVDRVNNRIDTIVTDNDKYAEAFQEQVNALIGQINDVKKDIKTNKDSIVAVTTTAEAVTVAVGDIKKNILDNSEDVIKLAITRVDGNGVTVGETNSSTKTNIDAAGLHISSISGNPVAEFASDGAYAPDLTADKLTIGGLLITTSHIDGSDWGAAYWVGVRK